MRLMKLILASAVALANTPSLAQEQVKASAEATVEVDTGRWVTLGTEAGPLPSPTRSQPANLLIADGQNILIDVGDGTAGQLALLGIATAKIDAVFISHLHFDHTGGLAAILGLRAQTNAPPNLKIYGPPGTAEMVAGILASMTPGATAGYGVPGAPRADVGKMTEVVELRDHDNVEIAGMIARVRKNTHYSFKPGSDLDKRFESLSFRFDLPGRSIVYTGDTGPSSAVEDLAKGADLLVAEMMDIDDTIANIKRANPNMPQRVATGMEQHLRSHHLLPRDVGEMAARAGVSAVVVTHFAGRERGDPKHFEYLRSIAEQYDGPVVIANDMDVF